MENYARSTHYRLSTKPAKSSGPENIGRERPLSGLPSSESVLSPSRITLENSGKILSRPDRENDSNRLGGGDEGIRTLEALWGPAPLAGVCLRPLGHVSAAWYMPCPGLKQDENRTFLQAASAPFDGWRYTLQATMPVSATRCRDSLQLHYPKPESGRARGSDTKRSGLLIPACHIPAGSTAVCRTAAA